MARVIRFQTLVDTTDTNQARSMSVSAHLDAVLADGERVVLLDDRGWSGTRSDGGDPWEFESVEGIQLQARTVVGPDEPRAGCSRADAEAEYWSALAQTLRRRGVEVSATELASVPHDVHLSDRVLERIGEHRP